MRTFPAFLTCLIAVRVAGVDFSAAAEAHPPLAACAPIPAFAGSSRTYAVTDRAGFAKDSFVAEVTVTLASGNGGNGCAFLGLGDGTPNPANFNEPTTAPSLVFRLGPGDFAGGRVDGIVDGRPVETAQLGDGTHRLRLIWDVPGKRAALLVHRDWKVDATFAPTVSIVIPTVNAAFGEGTRLFVGGAAGDAFADLALRGSTAADMAAIPTTDVFPNDPSAGTWLPVAGSSAQEQGHQMPTQLEAVLKPSGGSLRPVVCWYKDASLVASRALGADTLKLPNSSWDGSVEVQPVAGEPDALDLTLTVKLSKGGALASGVAAAFDFTYWSAENYVLVPASIYNGNRNRIEHRGYCTGFDQADFYNKAMTQATTECPQLSPEPGKVSKFEVSSCNVTTPAVCIYDRKTKRGFILLAEQAGRGKGGGFLRKENGEIMDSAFAIEESADRSRATLVVSAPGVRSRKPEFIGFGASPDRGMTMMGGDSVTLKLRLHAFAADGIPAFLDKFMTQRKNLTGPTSPRVLMPFCEAERRMLALLDGRYWHDLACGGGFYLTGNALGYCYGWVGGLINAFPPLAQGDALHRDRAFKSFDYAIKPSAQGVSDLYLAAMDDKGKPVGRDWYPHLPITLTRQEGDILFWTLKSFMLLKAQGHGAEIKSSWEGSVRKLAEGLATSWKKYGQWGNYLNHETGEPAIYGSTSGASAVGGLALASAYFGEPEFLRIAKEAGTRMYETDFVAKGFTYGACSDIMQNADSETAAALMTSLMALHDVTGEKEWLEKSRNLANLLATWTVSYDYDLPKFTELGGIGARLTGAVWASTQNKHGAPGICTSSGDPLLKIFRATGDVRYADLLRDIARAWQEGVKPSGNINERLTYCDADSRGARGAADDSTPWNVINGALMAREIPGIYLRVDADRFYVFDAVEAKVLSRDADGVKVEIRNPTKFDTKVSLFAEDAAHASKPAGSAAFAGWPRVEVSSGATKAVTISPDGTIHE